MSTFRWNPEAFIESLRRGANAGASAAAVVGADAAVRSFGSDHGGVPSKPGSPPNSQSGNLRNSVAATAPGAMGNGRAAFGTAVFYGKVMENGATIRAKRTKFLPVPLNVAAKRLMAKLAGSSVGWAGGENVGSLRMFNLVVIRAGGRLFLVEPAKSRSGKKGERMPTNGARFLLAKSVTIKPRPWLAPLLKSAPLHAKMRAAAAIQMREAFVMGAMAT